jgi:hypothetical protein
MGVAHQGVEEVRPESSSALNAAVAADTLTAALSGIGSFAALDATSEAVVRAPANVPECLPKSKSADTLQVDPFSSSSSSSSVHGSEIKCTNEFAQQRIANFEATAGKKAAKTGIFYVTQGISITPTSTGATVASTDKAYNNGTANTATPGEAACYTSSGVANCSIRPVKGDAPASNTIMGGHMLSFPFGSLRWLQFAALPVLTADSCKTQLNAATNAMQEQHEELSMLHEELNMLQREHLSAVLRLCAVVPEDILCQGASTSLPPPNSRRAVSTLPTSATAMHTIPRLVHHMSIVHHTA